MYYGVFTLGMSFGELTLRTMYCGWSKEVYSIVCNAGLLISAFCGNENTALQVSIATFYPVLVLSGKMIG